MKNFFILLVAVFLSLPLYSQPNVKASIDEMQAKLNQFQKTLAEIKANTTNLSDVIKNMKDKTDFLSDDFFTPDFLNNIKQSSNDIKEIMTAQAAGRRKFHGPGNNCNPGTECFKFKKEITTLITGIEKLNSTIIGTKAANLDIADKLNKIVTDAPNIGLYMAYESIGPLLTLLNKEIAGLTTGLEQIKSDMGEMASAQPGKITSPSGIRGKGPSVNSSSEILLEDMYGKLAPENFRADYKVENIFAEINTDNPTAKYHTELTTMDISDFCKKDRETILKLEGMMDFGILLLKLTGKFIQEGPDGEVAAGGSFVGHAAVHYKANIPKMIGVLVEAAGDGCNIILENWKGKVADCETQKYQKTLFDNQKILLENQVLLFQELEKTKGNPQDN